MGCALSLHVVKLAPYVCPTCGFDNPAAFVKVMETGIAIGLQDAREVR
jgi:hypothetical protein